MGDMISCAAISKHHSLLVTANDFGYIVTWDLETAKILNVQKASSERITFVSFLGKYPILVNGTSDGHLSLWATKTAPLEHRFQCIGMFRNLTECDEDDRGVEELGISCGVTKVLEIRHSHQLMLSDAIEFNEYTFSQHAYTNESSVQKFETKAYKSTAKRKDISQQNQEALAREAHGVFLQREKIKRQ